MQVTETLSAGLKREYKVVVNAAELDKELNVVIGKTTGPLDSRRNIVRTQEAAIGNLLGTSPAPPAAAEAVPETAKDGEEQE